MAEYLIQDTSLTSIADAIREKAGLEDNLAFPAGFVEAIAGISAGGGYNGFTCGIFTPAEDTTEITIQVEHDEEYIDADIFVITAIDTTYYSTALDFYKSVPKRRENGYISHWLSSVATNKGTSNHSFSPTTQVATIQSYDTNTNTVNLTIPNKYPYNDGCVYGGGISYAYIFAKLS